MPKILAFAGSGRKKSYNFSITKCAAQGANQDGVEVTVIDMSEFDMPIFNEDLEAAHGLPANAKKFKQLLMSHDGFIIGSPEYNSGYSGLLKNAIDWASRKEEGEKPLQAFKGKYAAIIATSSGALGGIRGLVPLRMLLGNIGMHVLPDQLAVGGIGKLVDEEQNVVDEKTKTNLHAIGRTMAEALLQAAK
ncbi:MAG: NAD(P)H-dependent FMN reductase [Bermanella sp.]|jgi:NAD(P)H-dependent FMN reductase|uniref:NADPH-dependent FMN reductase n=1 Tax=Glaciecola sp. 33A TaxID=2057807 RepID=UPI000C31F633|nr:NAD(P)H-dependent oxidoreductase [Glaciecola sp. 33A]PKH99840.1 FMN reductase [Glaciecola sp. 33A]